VIGREAWSLTLTAATRVPPPFSGSADEPITFVEGELAAGHVGRVEVVVNCGNLPPLFSVRLDRGGEGARGWTFAITHAIQDDLLEVIAAATEIVELTAPAKLTAAG
jgi:hypothetical protein